MPMALETKKKKKKKKKKFKKKKKKKYKIIKCLPQHQKICFFLFYLSSPHHRQIMWCGEG
jgi:hypothetical protein